MALFDFDSQYREKATIRRIFELSPLYAPLAEGHVFRWWALNIPMDLGTGGGANGELDIIGRLHKYPKTAPLQPYPSIRSAEFYKTWEVKVSLLCKDGTARSLKAGKTRGTINQMKAYRQFGAPDVSLLDVYVCESGFPAKNNFPPSPARTVIEGKTELCKANGFGYAVLPFEHDNNGDIDVGLRSFGLPTPYGTPSTHFKILSVVRTEPIGGFSRLMDRLHRCYETEIAQIQKKGFVAIVFCWECRNLSLTPVNEADHCPKCNADLLVQ
jgi:hypothetical protein